MKFKSTAIVFSLLLTLSGCATVAEMTGTNTAALNAQAASSYAQLKASEARAIDTTSNTARRVQTIFNRLRPHADAANKTGAKFEWEITTFRSDELNAWAMPGGKMAVYTGLVDKLKLTDDELAAIIGHEMAHALQEHSKKQAGQQALTGLAMKYGSQVLQAKTNIGANSIDLGASLLSEFGIDKPYSRNHEFEADRIGVLLMAQAGYNPQNAIGVWEKMKSVTGNSSTVSSLMSTHPNHDARMAAIKKQLPEVMPIYEQAKQQYAPAASTSKSSSKTSKKR